MRFEPQNDHIPFINGRFHKITDPIDDPNIASAFNYKPEDIDQTIRKAIDRGEDIYFWDFTDAVSIQIYEVADWVNSLSETNPRLIPKIGKITWAQAVEASNKWHEQIGKQSLKKKLSYIPGGDDVRTIMSFPDGMRWVELLTPAARDYEGTFMGHCVGSENYDNKRILSLRDKKNKPHCTIEIEEDDGSWQQVKGKGNKEIVERYRPYVIALANEIKPKEIRDARNFGCVFIDGILYEYDKLPDGLVVNGNLYLYGLTELKNLPNDLTVHGDLYLSGCAGITKLPDDLIVDGSLYLHDCTGLTHLRDGLVVNRNLYLPGCTGLKNLPNNLIVHRDINLHGCINLTNLPDDLIVDGEIILSGCVNLKSIPEYLRSKCKYIPEHLDKTHDMDR